MYQELLKKLEENADAPGDNIWHITLYSDGSGELVHPSEAVLTMYHDVEELSNMVDALCEAGELLTVARCVEIILEIEVTK